MQNSEAFLLAKHPTSEIYHPPHYPDECIGLPKNGPRLRELIQREYPDACHPENLPAVPSAPDKILNVPTPEYILQADPHHPPYLILRCVSVISARTQEQLLAAWDRVKTVKPRQYIKREHGRSATPAYHWGVWEASSLRPFITRETRDQSVEAIAAIDQLLNLVRQRVVPKAVEMIRHYLPEQWKAQERCVAF